MNLFEVIDDYYPDLPPDATTQQRLLRSMQRLLEEKEYYERMHSRLQQFGGANTQLPDYSEAFDQLKSNIRNLSNLVQD